MDAPPPTQSNLPLKRLTGMAIVGLSIVLVIQLAGSAYNWCWAQAKRTTCAASLRAIDTLLGAYANENGGYWPIAEHPPATEAGIGRVRYAPGIIGEHRDSLPAKPTGEAESMELSTTVNLWALIRSGAATPTLFVCPDSHYAYGGDDEPEKLWDFPAYEHISFGYQVPYGLAGRPHMQLDPRMVLMADKGPYSNAMELHEGGPGPPTAALPTDAKRWRPWNTPSHHRSGQNVLHVDGSDSWEVTPLAGSNGDNIYTRWSDPTGGTDADPTPRIHGTSPTGIETPFGDTDSLVYP